MKPLFVLASASPIRKQLLTECGIQFIVDPSHADESSFKENTPTKRAESLAVIKAQSVASKHTGAIILGCDTVIESSTGELFEKPKNKLDAQRMLQFYTNSYCDVHTGVCIITPDTMQLTCVETTRLYYRAIPTDLEQWWLDLNLWQGKAGGIQVEQEGQLLIKKIEGELSNAMGLPIHKLSLLLEEIGYPLYTR